MLANTGIVEATVVRPGDTLIVRVRPNIYPDDLAEIRERLVERLPASIELLVLAGSEQLVACRCGGSNA